MIFLLHILTTLIPVFGIMFLGAWAERRSVLPNNATLCLNQFVYWFCLPMLLFYLLASSNTEHVHMGAVLGCGLGLILVQCITLAVLRCMNLSWKDSMLGSLLTSFPNATFMGIPIILLLFPDNSSAKVMAGIAGLLPTISFVTADVFLSQCNASVQGGTHPLKNVAMSLAKNPAMWGVSLGLVVLLLEIPLPIFVLEFSKMLGTTAAPCALFCMGMSLAAQLHTWKQGTKVAWAEQGVLLFCKLFLAPALVYACAWAFGASGVALATITITCAMPCGVTCHIVAMKHDALVDGCANAVLFSTVLSVFLLPLVIAVVQYVTAI